MYIYFDTDEANLVLTAMEAAGMLPPTRYVFYTTDGQTVPGSYEYGAPRNEWEPEDETK